MKGVVTGVAVGPTAGPSMRVDEAGGGLRGVTVGRTLGANMRGLGLGSGGIEEGGHSKALHVLQLCHCSNGVTVQWVVENQDAQQAHLPHMVMHICQ